EEKDVVIGFKAVNVFDVSQTEGEALPTICNELQGNGSAAAFIIDRLMKVIKIPVKYGDTGSAKGCYHPLENWIKIKPGMSDNQTAKTLAHEYAHSLLHSGKCEKPTDLKEIEAESVAFIVCNYFGLETNEYSFEYLASWSHKREKKEIRELGELIQKTAAKIIDEISAVTGGVDYIPTDTVPAAQTVEPDAKPPVHKAGKKIEITVKKRQPGGEVADVTVTAYTTATPGLVVHKAVTGRGYILTHQSSGLMVAGFDTKKEAMEKAALSPKTVDWTGSPEEIKNSPDAAEFVNYTLKGLQPVKKAS
ncbi:MAG: ImmA/IrrE family metallo-endopeptidase, partial [Firmicutes bacterium]|nr:ImmA/IrrE family metallo-endopeptidase [Bacillota bacterium]